MKKLNYHETAQIFKMHNTALKVFFDDQFEENIKSKSILKNSIRSHLKAIIELDT